MTVSGLKSRPELNGKRGRVVRYVPDRERYHVVVTETKEETYLKRANIEVLTTGPPAEPETAKVSETETLDDDAAAKAAIARESIEAAAAAAAAAPAPPIEEIKDSETLLREFFADVSDAESEAPTLAQAGTTPGTVLGTVGYMSPEQARGTAADFRSDQFSFGAILYEMTTGRRAFDGETPADRLSAILRDEPPEPAGASPDVRSVLARCLAKSPEDRYRSTRELAEALSGSASPTDVVSPPPRTIAVLPFDNLMNVNW